MQRSPSALRDGKNDKWKEHQEQSIDCSDDLLPPAKHDKAQSQEQDSRYDYQGVCPDIFEQVAAEHLPVIGKHRSNGVGADHQSQEKRYIRSCTPEISRMTPYQHDYGKEYSPTDQNIQYCSNILDRLWRPEH